ncbi:hypothetical protein CSKR_107684, partial [Clonorchis sinensis]
GVLTKFAEPSSDGFQKCLGRCEDVCLRIARGRACDKCNSESDKNCKDLCAGQPNTEEPYVEPWDDGYERCLGKCETEGFSELQCANNCALPAFRNCQQECKALIKQRVCGQCDSGEDEICK